MSGHAYIFGKRINPDKPEPTVTSERLKEYEQSVMKYLGNLWGFEDVKGVEESLVEREDRCESGD